MKTLLTASALPFALPAYAAQDLTGQRNVHNNVGGNQFDQHCKLTVSDNKVTGTCKLKDDDYQVTGVIDGGNATWQYDYDSMNGRPVSFVFRAPLDDPSKIPGPVTVMPFGLKGEFTATPGSEPGVTATEQPFVIKAGPGGFLSTMRISAK